MAPSSVDNGMVRQLFVKLDKNGDGTIERSELEYAYKQVYCKTPTAAELRRLMPEDSVDFKMDFPLFQKFLSEAAEKDLKELCEKFRLKTHEDSLRNLFGELGYRDWRSALDKKENDRDEVAGLFTKLETAHKIQYKGHESEGLNAMHIAVHMCEPGESGPVDVLLRRLQGEEEEQKVEYLKQPFPYTGKGGNDCEAQAVHLAAATGKKAALLSLIGAAAGLVNARARFGENDHASPLHDAAFSQHADIVSELLGKRADATIADNKGMTALHVVAQQGEDEQTVQKMVSSLLEKRADLVTKVLPKDAHNVALHKKTAFAIAADRALSKNFPMKALHLLTPNFVEVASGNRMPAGMLFHDIKDAANCGLEPGEALARALLDEPYKETTFAQAMDKGTAPVVLNMLARLTVRLPVLGATLLDALTDTPEVKYSKTHGLPTLVSLGGFMGLSAPSMRCAYEAYANEKGWPEWNASSPPAWQRKWIDSVSQNHTTLYRVKIQAIHLPNVLDKQMVQALALTPFSSLEIFASKSVQAVVRAGWDQVQYTYCADLAFNILILPLMLVVGTRHDEAWNHCAWCLLLIASVGDTVSLLLVLFAFPQTKGQLDEGDVQTRFRITWLRWLASSLNWVVDAASCLPLIGFVFMSYFEQDWKTGEFDVNSRVWLSVTFLLRCWKVMYMLRGQVKSFNAFFSAFAAREVMNILFFVALCFFTFCGAFVVLTETPPEKQSGEPSGKPPEKPPKMLDCVKALLFSEWSGADGLMKANGENSVFSQVLTYVCLALFTFCFNSIITAVFSDKYTDDDRRSGLIFLNERARLTLKYLYRRQGAGDVLQWASRRQGASGILAARWMRVPFAVLLVSMLLSWVLGWSVIGPKAMTIGRVCGAVAAVAVIGVAAILVVLVVEGPLEVAEDCRRFVWLCYREDFDPDVFQYGSLSDDSCKIEKIKQSLDAQATRSEELERKMERKMEAMEQLVGGVSNQMAQLEGKLGEVQATLANMQSSSPASDRIAELERKLDMVLGALERTQSSSPAP